MCAERDGAVGVRGDRTMNLPVPVDGSGLWASWEPLRRHILNICRHISPEMNGGLNSRQTATSFHPSRSLSLAYVFVFFWVSFQKSRNLLS